MNKIRVCFLGTPEFAAQHLESLLQDEQFEVVGVVTQPDRPAGRKMQLTASEVKVIALKYKLSVVTPVNLRKEPDIFQTIKSWQADVAVVVAFGQILSQEFLDSFKFGAVNVHGSLLPKWRGAAPIQRAIEAGDLETGVCLQKMVKKLDAGSIIGERRIQLDDKINSTQLYQNLANLGCELLKHDLVKYVRGEIQLVEQDEAKVTYAAKIDKEESLITWNLPALKIHNKIRAFSMGPGTFVLFQGKRLKIHATEVVDNEDESLVENCGKIFKVNSDLLIIHTAKGLLSLIEVQPESKSKMKVAEFLKNIHLKAGDYFV